MSAVFRKELKAMLRSPRSYVAFALYLSVFAVFFIRFYMAYGFSGAETTLSYSAMAWGLALPILTVPVLIPKDGGEAAVLHSLPLRAADVFAGKYFAMLIPLLIATLPTLASPLILSGFLPDGKTINYATAYVGSLTFFLMGHALLSLNMLLASLIKRRTVAYVTCYLLLTVLIVLSITAGYAPAGLSTVMEQLSLFGACGSIEVGLLDPRCLILYLSVSALCLGISSAVERAKWNV